MATVFKFKADGSGYARGLNEMRQQTKKFAGSVKGLLAAAFAGAGVTGVKSLLDDITEINRASRRLGMSAEGFQRITNAANALGISTETITDAIKDLNVKITDGATGAKSYAEAFALIGLSVDELFQMSPEEQFYAFSDAIKAAGGNLAAFNLDEINDAMYQSVDLMRLGSEGIKDLGEQFDILTQKQLDAAEASKKLVDATFIKLKTQLGVFVTEAALMLEYYVAIVTQAWKELKDLGAGGFVAPNEQELKRFGEAVGFGDGAKEGETAMDRIREAGEKVLDKQIAIEESIMRGVENSHKQIEAQRENARWWEFSRKAAEEREKREKDAMTASERLNDLTAERAQIEKELAELDPFGVAYAEKRAKLEAIITAEKKAQKELQDSMGDELEDFFSDLDEQEAAINKELERQAEKREEIADINARIAEEQKGREEAGMTPEELQERRTSEAEKAIAELAELRKKALEDGKIDLDEEKEIASKRLEAEEAITAATMQDTGGADPSIISSALASIGAGGGTAMFTQDPLLNENKRQTDLLAKISAALGAGDGTRGNPEL